MSTFKFHISSYLVALLVAKYKTIYVQSTKDSEKQHHSLGLKFIEYTNEENTPNVSYFIQQGLNTVHSTFE